MRRECNDDRCPSRKFNKYAFCVNGLVSVEANNISTLMFSFSAILWMCRLKQKALKSNDTSSSHFVCQAAWQTSKIWMHRLAFEYGFYFKFYEYSNEMLLTGSCSTVQTLIVSRDQHWFSSKPVLCSDRFACATLNYWSELINGLRSSNE